MPVQVSYPGVYVQEEPSGVRTITGVSTSIAMFVGRTERGILNRPTLIFSFSDYVRSFGAGTRESEMAHQVRQFFTNGGTQAYVMRVASGASEARVDLIDAKARRQRPGSGSEGSGHRGRPAAPGGRLRHRRTRKDLQSAGLPFRRRWRRRLPRAGSEVFSDLTMDTTAARYAPDVVTQGSRLVSLVDPGAARVPGVLIAGLVLGANEDTEMAAIIGEDGQNRLRISVGGRADNVDLTGAADPGTSPPRSKPVRIGRRAPQSRPSTAESQSVCPSERRNRNRGPHGRAQRCGRQRLRRGRAARHRQRGSRVRRRPTTPTAAERRLFRLRRRQPGKPLSLTSRP